MADDELPSFSLGLDSDSDTAPPSPVLEPRDLDPGSASDGDFDRRAELGPEPDLDVPPRSLRRLRRGLPGRSCPNPNPNGEDDIEEFSSQEEVVTVEKSSVGYQSVCSSTKLPLSRHSGIIARPSSKLSTLNRKQPCEDAASANQRTSCSEVFQKPLVSPLRKFLLVDSDSDGPCISGRVNKEANESAVSSKSKIIASQSNQQQKDDLWKDFQPVNSFSIPTPALDEVCNEYFHSLKSKSQPQPKPVVIFPDEHKEESVHHQLDLTNSLPPSHRYFFHSDQRVQNLVRSRLPYFVPLGNAHNREIMQLNSSVIDYMSQFNNGETSKRQLNQKAAPKKRSSAQSRSRSVTPLDNWVDPRSSVTKNAGKRRVHANGKSAGHWYTGADGRKVYVAANGQELSGQSAYRHYRKESGTSFKRSKKKPRANKRAKK